MKKINFISLLRLFIGYTTLTILSILISGCASAPSLPNQTEFGKRSIEHAPPLDTQATAEIGQNIISSTSVIRTRAVIIAADVSEKIVPPFTTTVRAGAIPLFTSNEQGEFFRDPNATFSGLGQTVPNERAGVFVPQDKAQRSVIYHFTSKFNFGKIPVPVEFSIIEKWTRDSFRKELVYSGVSQNTITILYREFNENIARPEFSQELKYDLSQGKSIGYKGARFEIIKATNTEIIYKVIKALD